MLAVRLPVITSSALPIAALQRELRGEVRLGAHDRALYATDASIYQVQPLAVVIPQDGHDVARTIAFCARHGLPILPRGGGTSLAGQTVNRAVVIDFSVHCHRILDIDAENRRAIVEPGVILNQLNRALAPHGLMFGPDVATANHANLGGMIGNNSAGAHSILYGRTVDHVIGLDVILANGEPLTLAAGSDDARVQAITAQVARVIDPLAAEIDARFPKILRHVNGYNLDIILQQMRNSTPGTHDRINLAHLVTGSEGTLAVTTRAHLQLVEAPTLRSLAIVPCADVDTALEQVSAILDTGPAAVELIDDTIINLAQDNAECRAYLNLLPTWKGRLPGAVLYVEYFSTDDAQRAAQHQALNACTIGAVRYDDAASQRTLWALRKHGEPLLHGLPDPRKPLTFIEDVAVDPAVLPAFVREFRELVARHGTTAAYYAHASVGCLHIRPRINLRDAADRAAMEAIAAEAADLVVRYNGALSGEHGDGRLRSPLLERFYGPRICEAFREIKRIFDPRHLLNPGNIVDSPPMTTALRVDAAAHEPTVDTYFRYTAERGFRNAIELCNGAGVCRKPPAPNAGGTMCPSYHATRDERHSTRGRGNALRHTIFGDHDLHRWNDPDTLNTLDLCLSCKACKAECPSNVDMARYKSEYLAQSYRHRGGVPLAARAVAHIRALNNAAARIPRLSNAIARSRVGRAMMQRILNIDPQRSLPTIHSRSALPNPRHPRHPQTPDAPIDTVLLFLDCFTMTNEPHIVRAACTGLEALGVRVIFADAGCCGRSAISVGALDIAQPLITSTARTLADLLHTHNRAPLLFLEPSCLSAVTDDWLDLHLPDISDADRHRIAGRSMLIEDYLHTNMSRLPLIGGGGRILLHGHCHQKTLWGLEPTADLLRAIPGCDVTVLDSGCCGMAGYFGYTTDHYDLSMQIGELSLFSTLREHNHEDAIVCAPGTSCRHQLRDGMGIEALHPVEVVAASLEHGAPAS